jgi:hypothetical protein
VYKSDQLYWIARGYWVSKVRLCRKLVSVVGHVYDFSFLVDGATMIFVIHTPLAKTIAKHLLSAPKSATLKHISII